MNVEGLQLLKSIQPEMALEKLPQLKATEAVPAQNLNFEKVLLDGMQELNTAQSEVGQQISGFLAGKGPNVHTLMLGIEQASLSVELAVQVRNKVIDAYNEIMRIQV